MAEPSEVSTPPSATTEDELRTPLLIARVFAVLFCVAPVVLGMLLWARLAGSVRTGQGPLVLFMFSGMGLLEYGLAVLSGVLFHRFAHQPVLQVIGVYVTDSFAFVLILLGFVASITYSWAVPYLVALPLPYALFIVFWPRRSAWERAHVQNRQGDLTTAST